MTNQSYLPQAMFNRLVKVKRERGPHKAIHTMAARE